MPLKNNVVYCVNHSDTPCRINDTFNALMLLKKKGSEYSFELASGMPVVTYYCEICGYVELYSAQKTHFWEKGIIE